MTIAALRIDKVIEVDERRFHKDNPMRSLKNSHIKTVGMSESKASLRGENVAVSSERTLRNRATVIS